MLLGTASCVWCVYHARTSPGLLLDALPLAVGIQAQSLAHRLQRHPRPALILQRDELVTVGGWRGRTISHPVQPTNFVGWWDRLAGRPRAKGERDRLRTCATALLRAPKV
jgi:hypothetical protein